MYAGKQVCIHACTFVCQTTQSVTDFMAVRVQERECVSNVCGMSTCSSVCMSYLSAFVEGRNLALLERMARAH